MPEQCAQTLIAGAVGVLVRGRLSVDDLPSLESLLAKKNPPPSKSERKRKAKETVEKSVV